MYGCRLHIISARVTNVHIMHVQLLHAMHVNGLHNYMTAIRTCLFTHSKLLALLDTFQRQLVTEGVVLHWYILT